MTVWFLKPERAPQFGPSSTLGGASLGLVILGLGLVSLGCDSGSFVPPRPPELGGGDSGLTPVTGAIPSRSAEPGAGARSIELILGPLDPYDVEDLTVKARFYAGNEKHRIQVAAVGATGNPDSEAELVRKVITHDPLALIIEPARTSDVELAGAVSEARNRGFPVILISRSLDTSKSPEPDSSENRKGAARTLSPLIQVLSEPFKNSAQNLVKAAINNARNAKLEPKEGAILMFNTASDQLAEDRAQAIRDALNEAGITTIEELRFEREIPVAKQKLTELLRARPKIGMVLSIDQVGLTSSFQLLETIGKEHSYVVAGYTREESSARLANSGQYAGVAIFGFDRLIRKAISTAASLARGDKLPERVEVPIPLHISPPSSAEPSMFRQMEAMKKLRDSR
jgi:ABC-type sugar transport system substrate-binding protein